MTRLLSELDGIREVVAIYPRKRRQQSQRRQSMLTRLSELQVRLVEVLDIKGEEQSLG